jgi:hypothetical protein
MGKRFAIVIGAAALGAALMAAGASADFRSVHDPRGDTTCGHEHVGNHPPPCSAADKRDADIVGATAGHAGGRLRHTIRVVGKVQHVSLYISTDSDPDCEREVVFIERGRGKAGRVRLCGQRRTRVGRARYDFHHHSVKIVFSERSIGNPQSYGWSVDTLGGPMKATAFDRVPKYPRYIRHRLAQTTAAASAGVHKHKTVKIDSRVTLPPPQERPFYGRVKASRHACLVHRLVKVYRVTPGRDHVADQGDAKDRTSQHGKWRNRQLILREGNFYAKVVRRKEANFVCRPDRSPTRHVQHQG